MAGSAQLEKEFQQFQKGQPSLGKVRGRISRNVGLGRQRKDVRNLRQTSQDVSNLLRELPANVASESKRLGGAVTQGQVNKLTGARQQPLTNQLRDVTGALGIAQQGQSDLENEVLTRLGLIQSQRQDKSSDFQRRIANALQTESQNRAIAASNRGGIDPGDIQDLIDKAIAEFTNQAPLITPVSKAGTRFEQTARNLFSKQPRSKPTKRTSNLFGSLIRK